MYTFGVKKIGGRIAMILPRFFQKYNFRLTKIAFRKLEARNPF